MADLLTLENFFTLLMLVLLQAVLGFDNLLYISIESRRVTPESAQAKVRYWGIGIALVLRLILLFVILKAVQLTKKPFFTFDVKNIIEGSFNFHSAIVLVGGVFIIYTAFKEILHMMTPLDFSEEGKNKSKRSVKTAIIWIVAMNLIFSFDSILTAMNFTEVFAIMATAIVISGIAMIWLADHVSEFIEKNRMYEVLGLFILFIVGIMLLSEGGHLAHLKFFNFPVEPMSKTTFYFTIAVLVLVDIVQGRYQKKLMSKNSH